MVTHLATEAPTLRGETGPLCLLLIQFELVQPRLRQPTKQCTPRAAPDRRMPVGTQLDDDNVYDLPL